MRWPTSGAAAYMFAKTTFELDGCAPGASIDATERFYRCSSLDEETLSAALDLRRPA